jgi:SAM-dependent methyltransferase
MDFFKNLAYIFSFSASKSLAEYLRLVKWSRLRPQRVLVLAKVLKSIPPDVKEIFREKFLEKDHGTQAGKYFDIRSNVARAVAEMEALDLLGANSPIRIFDLGTGFGYFPLACQSRGHHCYSSDLKSHFINNYAREKLKVDSIYWEITPEQPMPEVDQPFDLITAFQPVFFLYGPIGTYEGEYGSLWSRDQWETFFSQIKKRLKHSGRLYLGLNDFSLVESDALDVMIDCFNAKKAKRLSDGWVFEMRFL